MVFEAKKAEYAGFGAKSDGNGTYFCTEFNKKTDVGVFVFDDNSAEDPIKIPFGEDISTGRVFSVYVKGLSLKDKTYLYYEGEKTFPDKYSLKLENGKSKFVKQVSAIGFSEDTRPYIPYSEACFYVCNVKGLTAFSKAKDRGTFSALKGRMDGLKELGVTSVVLMPVYENDFSEDECKTSDRFSKKEGLKVNYWGFGKGLYFAIKSSLANGKDAAYELKNTVMALHKNGMECILIMNFDKESTDFISEVLRFYVLNFHIDGFRFVGSDIPVTNIINDPFLYDTKLIFENVPLADIPTDYTKKYQNVANIDKSFLNTARRFLKGDEDCVGAFSYMVRENRPSLSSIRGITDFSGFTLYDLVSYNRKHNEANNEDNTDGTDYNYSWNCGFEGKTSKRNVNALREKQVRNAMLLCCLAQGAPLLVAGDEYLNTQGGNNNPYCQDNETGWCVEPKTKTSREFTDFLKNLLAFRKRHSILHQPKELMMFDYLSCKVPDVSYHSSECFKFDQKPDSRAFGVMYCGEYARQYTGKTEESVYITYNMHWEEVKFALPMANEKGIWKLLYSTDGKTDESFSEADAVPVNSEFYTASPRSVSILLFERKADLTDLLTKSNM